MTQDKDKYSIQEKPSKPTRCIQTIQYIYISMAGKGIEFSVNLKPLIWVCVA